MTISILLDGGSQQNIVYAGQNVSGNVRVELKDEIKMRGEILLFFRSLKYLIYRSFSLCLVHSFVHSFILSFMQSQISS